MTFTLLNPILAILPKERHHDGRNQTINLDSDLSRCYHSICNGNMGKMEKPMTVMRLIIFCYLAFIGIAFATKSISAGDATFNVVYTIAVILLIGTREETS